LSLDPEVDDNGFSTVAIVIAVLWLVGIIGFSMVKGSVPIWIIFFGIPLSIGRAWLFTRRKPARNE